MTDESIGDDGSRLPEWTPPAIDRGKAHPARIYDYLLGGYFRNTQCLP
ncbi:SAM-dependent methyltransferase [Catenulispora sp. NL8]|uniref:SAM-dependent methyltransferase n=1 Tax=Catenulispora pinistramenti TaxID=2705254 RepID=A0ABS5KU86_9ACTN|nr:SAM-dependent methyltransferase [Catenulispora pinistramenti]MBS2549617.1 SAM-dependent methyltransferase [Catenulispora pinistramenti]